MSRDSGYARVEDDYYREPEWCVDALLTVEPIAPGTSVWDPSAGSGTIPRVLARHGIACAASDIVDRGCGAVVADFFACEAGIACTECIVSNPPYGVAEAYARHALKIAGDRVILITRLAWLESQTRAAFFAETPLARVWVSRRRISMPPGNSEIKAKGGTVAYAWFVFQHGHQGAPTIGWF